MSARDEGESDKVGGLPTEFRFDESPVRAVVQDDEPWFVAKDVCDILGIDNPSQAVGRLDDDEKGITNTYTTAGLREMLTVNESGVYSLVFTSRKPEAKRFRKWVTSEVLPEIRKTGGYRRPETEFAGLSGERVEYERWLLERALLDAKLIALGMQSILPLRADGHGRYGLRRGARRHQFRRLPSGAPRERPSIDRIHTSRPTRLRLQPRPETCRILKPTGSWLSRLNLFRRRCHFPFAPMAAKLSSPTRPRFSTMTAPLPRTPANSPAQPPLTRMSDELERLRASVNKLARAQNALLFNVKALSDQVHSLSGTVQQMASTMNGKAGEDVARRQLH